MITPDNGYEVDEVTVDGNSEGAITSYSFSNVTDDHTIATTFTDTTTLTQAIKLEEVGLSESEVLKCYPNPFNSMTTISYEVAEPGLLNLRVYNLYGQEVSILFDGFQMQGRHVMTWNAKTWSAEKKVTSASMEKGRLNSEV